MTKASFILILFVAVLCIAQSPLPSSNSQSNLTETRTPKTDVDAFSEAIKKRDFSSVKSLLEQLKRQGENLQPFLLS
jgi:hypothetical protein